jgi:hypothetical protein
MRSEQIGGLEILYSHLIILHDPSLLLLRGSPSESTAILELNFVSKSDGSGECLAVAPRDK